MSDGVRSTAPTRFSNGMAPVMSKLTWNILPLTFKSLSALKITLWPSCSKTPST